MRPEAGWFGCPKSHGHPIFFLALPSHFHWSSPHKAGTLGLVTNYRHSHSTLRTPMEGGVTVGREETGGVHLFLRAGETQTHTCASGLHERKNAQVGSSWGTTVNLPLACSLSGQVTRLPLLEAGVCTRCAWIESRCFCFTVWMELMVACSL